MKRRKLFTFISIHKQNIFYVKNVSWSRINFIKIKIDLRSDDNRYNRERITWKETVLHASSGFHWNIEKKTVKIIWDGSKLACRSFRFLLRSHDIFFEWERDRVEIFKNVSWNDDVFVWNPPQSPIYSNISPTSNEKLWSTDRTKTIKYLMSVFFLFCLVKRYINRTISTLMICYTIPILWQ